eukprot:6202375-Pleurochrysis_carterae.AAC.3
MHVPGGHVRSYVCPTCSGKVPPDEWFQVANALMTTLACRAGVGVACSRAAPPAATGAAPTRGAAAAAAGCRLAASHVCGRGRRALDGLAQACGAAAQLARDQLPRRRRDGRRGAGRVRGARACLALRARVAAAARLETDAARAHTRDPAGREARRRRLCHQLLRALRQHRRHAREAAAVRTQQPGEAPAGRVAHECVGRARARLPRQPAGRLLRHARRRGGQLARQVAAVRACKPHGQWRVHWHLFQWAQDVAVRRARIGFAPGRGD